MTKKTILHTDTLLTHAGNAPAKTHGTVNPPVYRASTIVHDSVAAYRDQESHRYSGKPYGLHGTPTTFALEDAIRQLEGGAHTVVTGSGLAAITAPLLSLLKQGQHVLMPDTVYGPTRAFCGRILKGFGIETTYYDPLTGSGIAALIRPETGIVFVESPGSLTFEVQDVPAIATAAHDAGALVMMDNTWAAGVFFKAFDHGADISVQALTKYVSGHSDVMMGSVTVRDENLFKTIRTGVADLGHHTAPDTCYLALRGLRTMSVRLRHQEQAALKIARWLDGHDMVASVRHPALESCPGHDTWKRDFTGSSGVFSFILQGGDEAAVAAMLDNMQLFMIGESWGGYESLILPARPGHSRTATTWDEAGPVVRVNIGLEDIDDLIADLDAGLRRYAGD